ncbi:MBL fold metallo-hydrolase [Streptomyces sp. TLI_171]|uniref:MBL fold metallo-hydrolase n=1 Tax=Streptomyces sp. TLI_171 TaxID=1938859 RepID=UPI000C184544|nr:MBL fold metallo-hydrolase [Streptomyces sp. TLI_171]RKE22417.1 glyoxylase-like metal-dependent hydrolase (beta-lactamase superfamily II) [Streptomyces sp. TLI_171]
MTEPTVHVHTGSEAGLFVNSYLLETAEGLVVVDTNLLNSDIAALVEKVAAFERAGRPLLGVFVTHAHPDHFNGVHALVERWDVPVYATEAVAGTIHEIADAKRAQWGPVYGEEWPAVTAYPTVLLKDGQDVVLGGTTFTVRHIGPAESHADSVILARRSPDAAPLAFIGDLAFHGTHPYTADGHGAHWLAALTELGAELADAARLFPGHGEPAGVEVLTAQRQYLLFYRETVRRLAAGRPALSDQDREELDRALQDYAPGLPLGWMIGLGADAVAAELAGS